MLKLITSRRLSVLITLGYGAVLLFARPPSMREIVLSVLAMTGYFWLPLACIWYGDELGEYVGALPGPAINRRSPGWMVKAGGWFLLFLPAIIFLFTFRY
jgi:hypothetical protein